MTSKKPRICVLSARDFCRTAFMGGVYEAQDVLQSVDDAELIHLKPARGYQFRQGIQSRVVWHDFTRTLALANMAFEPIKLNEEYDLFVAYLPCSIASQLIQIPAVRGWKDHCKTSVCWIDEIYAAEIPKLKNWLPALEQFDHIVIGYSGTVAALTQAINRPVHCVPTGVDAFRFSPSPRPPERVVDLYNMGRRSEVLHQALLGIAAKNNMFYFYDTFETSMTNLIDFRQHRDMLANIMRRTRYFIVGPAKAGSPQATNNQIELGLRYYEASAAGTVMLGQIPHCETFKTKFNWQDAVVEIQPDGSNVADVIAGLDSPPERHLEISRRNAMEALLRHDWAYRWRQIFDIAGIDPGPQLEIREKKLKQLAECIANG